MRSRVVAGRRRPPQRERRVGECGPRSNGSILQDGDTVIVVKDLPVKGASSALKAGTKVKGIRLVEGDHNIDCRIEGLAG
jgi:protein PhnA